MVAGMRLLDDANSIPTSLYVDFGGLGMLLAGPTPRSSSMRSPFLGRGGISASSRSRARLFFWISFLIETEFVGYLDRSSETSLSSRP